MPGASKLRGGHDSPRTPTAHKLVPLFWDDQNDRRHCAQLLEDPVEKLCQKIE